MLVQFIDTAVLSVEDFYILATGIFSANNKFRRHFTDSVVVKLSYFIKLENLLENFGDYKEDIRAVPLSVHHNEKPVFALLRSGIHKTSLHSISITGTRI